MTTYPNCKATPQVSKMASASLWWGHSLMLLLLHEKSRIRPSRVLVVVHGFPATIIAKNRPKVA